MVNVLLAANPQRLVHDLMRLRVRRQDWWTFFCSQPSKRVRAANAEVVNELLWVAAKRTFTSPGPWPLVRLVSGVASTFQKASTFRKQALFRKPLVFTKAESKHMSLIDPISRPYTCTNY